MALVSNISRLPMTAGGLRSWIHVGFSSIALAVGYRLQPLVVLACYAVRYGRGLWLALFCSPPVL